jgi:rubrerythrin
VEVIRVLVEMGVNKEAKDDGGLTPLHVAAVNGHVEAVTVLAQLGADIAARTGAGETPLQASIRNGHHQVAQVLRELERELQSAARAQQAAARERAQQAAEQDIAEKREAADRVAAEILEDEEREQAAQTKVRLAPPSPHIGLHSVQLGGERCGVSVARVSTSPRTA